MTQCGWSGCDKAELHVSGRPHQPGHRAVLEQLLALCFVREIREAILEQE